MRVASARVCSLALIAPLRGHHTAVDCLAEHALDSAYVWHRTDFASNQD